MNDAAPIVSFVRNDGSPVLIGDLDADFLSKSSLGPSSWERPLRVELEPKLSKRGNTFFNYQQVLPLPDGLNTLIVVDGVQLMESEVYESQRGNPTKSHTGMIAIAGKTYDITCYVTALKSGCWVKVHAQVSTNRKATSSREVPQGGRFV